MMALAANSQSKTVSNRLGRVSRPQYASPAIHTLVVFVQILFEIRVALKIKFKQLRDERCGDRHEIQLRHFLINIFQCAMPNINILIRLWILKSPGDVRTLIKNNVVRKYNKCFHFAEFGDWLCECYVMIIADDTFLGDSVSQSKF